MKNLILSVIFGYYVSILPAAAAECITAQTAQDHIGEKTCVCGTVVSTKYASSSNSQPTFLNLDQPFPNQIFTIVIFGRDRPKFGYPESVYRNSHLCVSGDIETYRGKPEMIVTNPDQIKTK